MTQNKVAATAIVTLGTALYYTASNISAADLAAQRQNEKRTDAAYELVPARTASDAAAPASEAD